MKSLNRRPCSPTMLVHLRRIVRWGPCHIPDRTKLALLMRELIVVDDDDVCDITPRGRVALRMGR
jgi:hypothetical protein